MADNTPDGPRRRPAGRADDRPGSKKPKAVRPRDAAVDRPRTPDPTPAAKKKVSPLPLLVLLIPVIGFVIFMAVRQAGNRSAEREAFAAAMDQLVAPPAAGPVKATPGKVALIDVDKRELHYLHESNGGPWAEMQATTPAEAATIVQIRVTDREILRYLNGRKGVKQTFHLTVVDKATWTKIDERTFEGGDPPESIRLKGGGGTSEPVNGPLPTKEIREYLRGLCGG